MRRNPSRELIVTVTLLTLLTLLTASLAGNAYAEDANSGIDARELARELTADGWVVYGTDQCYFCNEQKEEFGDAFANMTYVNCMENRQACIDADVHGIPCWVSPNGTAYHGYHNLTRLSGLLNDYRAAHQTPPVTTAPATTTATAAPPNATGIDARELARELTADGWAMYGTDQCGWCVRQKEAFGDSFENVTFVNCMEDKQTCRGVSMYLFSWDDVTGEDSRLLEYLEDNCHADWVKSAEINRSEDGKTVSISDEQNSVEITLDMENATAILQIGDRAHHLKVRKDGGKINLYAGIEGIPCWVAPDTTLHPGYYNLTRLSGLLNDYRAAHPAPTPTQTPVNAIGFESVSALFAIAIVFLMRRR
ncbi:MAG: hypothetical protein J7J06_05935 [Methanosarcinales archaeon]|nr:hypothetical protein [Methanosarcinales archaeon]